MGAVEVFGYKAEDIVVLKDDGTTEARPDRDTIVSVVAAGPTAI